jgi:hypothetical protein
MAGGYPGSVCAHALYAGNIGELLVENSRFYDNHGGHNLKSRALKTEVLNCRPCRQLKLSHR